MACEETLNTCVMALAGAIVSVVAAFVAIVKAKQTQKIHEKLQRKNYGK